MARLLLGPLGELELREFHTALPLNDCRLLLIDSVSTSLLRPGAARFYGETEGTNFVVAIPGYAAGMAGFGPFIYGQIEDAHSGSRILMTQRLPIGHLLPMFVSLVAAALGFAVGVWYGIRSGFDALVHAPLGITSIVALPVIVLTSALLLGLWRSRASLGAYGPVAELLSAHELR